MQAITTFVSSDSSTLPFQYLLSPPFLPSGVLASGVDFGSSVPPDASLLALVCPGCPCKPSLLLGPREVMAFGFPVLPPEDRSDVTQALKCGA